MECRMDGRVAIITGGSLGLGRAMALEFARSGAKVAMVAKIEKDRGRSRLFSECCYGCGRSVPPTYFIIVMSNYYSSYHYYY